MAATESPEIAYWREGLQTVLEEVGCFDALTSEQYTAAAPIIARWADDKAYAFGEHCIPDPADRRHAEEIAALRAEIAERDRQIDCYRQSVATRRHVDVSDVYLDHNGDVIYGKA